MEIDLKIAEGILEAFGGEDAKMTLVYWKDAHSGEGYYIYASDYPEDGAIYLGTTEEQKMLSDYRKEKESVARREEAKEAWA